MKIDTQEIGQAQQEASAAVELRLYVTSGTPLSIRARANLDAIVKDFQPQVRLHVVDVLEQPLAALADGILVTPTLVKLRPGPVVRLVGDLTEQGVVISVLGFGGQDG